MYHMPSKMKARKDHWFSVVYKTCKGIRITVEMGITAAIAALLSLHRCIHETGSWHEGNPAYLPRIWVDE